MNDVQALLPQHLGVVFMMGLLIGIAFMLFFGNRK